MLVVMFILDWDFIKNIKKFLKVSMIKIYFKINIYYIKFELILKEKTTNLVNE